LSFVQGTLVNLLRNSILFLMMYLIYAGKISIGEFFSLFIYSFFIFGPLQELGNIINTYRETEVSLANFKKIMSTPKEMKPANPMLLNQITHLTFDDVSFQHLTANRNALNHVSFKTRIGKTIAFVGPSGSGKTTLVKLLVGLYQPQEGQVLYNDIPSDLI